MAYNNGLLNFGDSIVEVGYNNENYSVDKARIVDKDGTVHELGGGGSGDLSIATVSFIYNTTASNISSFIGAVALESGEMGYEHNACTYANLVIGESFKPASLKVIMYKGEATVEAYDGGFNVPLTVTGSAVNDNGWITITGDCTFTFGS